MIPQSGKENNRYWLMPHIFLNMNAKTILLLYMIPSSINHGFSMMLLVRPCVNKAIGHGRFQGTNISDYSLWIIVDQLLLILSFHVGCWCPVVSHQHYLLPKTHGHPSVVHICITRKTSNPLWLMWDTQVTSDHISSNTTALNPSWLCWSITEATA